MYVYFYFLNARTKSYLCILYIFRAASVTGPRAVDSARQ
jgi:hypothetical protein